SQSRHPLSSAGRRILIEPGRRSVAATGKREAQLMSARIHFIPWLLRAALASAVLLLIGLSGPGAEETASREQQIADSERQMQHLTKQLAELRRMPASAESQSATTIPPEWIKTLSWRGIGPAAMGGRIVAFSVYEADPTIYWVATASGGLLKTTNNGITF